MTSFRPDTILQSFTGVLFGEVSSQLDANISSKTNSVTGMYDSVIGNVAHLSFDVSSSGH